LADQAEPDHHRDFAEPRCGHTNPLKRDGAEGRESGAVEVEALRNASNEVLGYGHPFGMVRVTGPRAGDAVARNEIADPFADARDDAGA